MSKEVKKTIEYRIIEITDFSFSYNDHKTDQQKKLEATIEVKAHLGFNKEKKSAVLYISTKFYNDPKKEKKIISLDVGVVFEITNFDDFYNKGKDIFRLPNNVVIIFTSLSLSTVRGILFEKLRGTLYHHLLLPVLNPTAVAPIDHKKEYTEVNFVTGKTMAPTEFFSKINESV
jgi:hypothetical protein